MGMENNSIAELYSSHPIPVATKCIRVLDVHVPSSSQPDGGPVQGSLRVIDLDQEPIFSALSYVWGPFSTPPKTISCESVAVPVSDSCYSALTHLRRKLGGLTIWNDAICINQASIAEKQLQIPLMGDIYDRATRVFVWLGEGTSATDRAMIYIRTCGLLEYFFADGDPTGAELQAPRSWRAFFSTYFSRWSFKTYFNPFIKDDMNWFWRISYFNNVRKHSTANSASFHDLNELLSRDWIKRIWTYQEIILASNPIVVCGDMHLNWSQFALAMIFIDYIRPEYVFDATNAGPWDGWKKVFSSRDRNIHLDVPIVPIVATWKKIVLIRDQVMATRQSKEDGKSPSRQTGQLRRYQEFVHKVSYRHTLLRKPKMFFVLIPVTVILTSIALIAPIAVGKNTPPKIPSWQTDPNACLDFCQAGNLTFCSQFCSPANMTERLNAFYGDWHPTGNTLLPFLALPIGMVVLLLLILINSQLPPNTPFPRVTKLVREHELKEDAVNDLADGISTRQAKNPLDMAFGMQSVIEKLLNRTTSPPDYKRPKMDVYRDMTIHLLEVMPSLQPLISAALHNFEVGPSWIPDWSKDFPIYWLKPLDSFQGGKSASPNSRPWRKLEVSPEGVPSLTVFGHRICTVKVVYRFALTSDTFREDEGEAHLCNMGLMLRVFKYHWGSVELKHLIKCQVNFPDLPEDISAADLDAYWVFLEMYHNLDASDALLLLSTGQSIKSAWLANWLIQRRAPFRRILRAHICICNSLARTARGVFFTEDLRRCSAMPPGVAIGELSRTMGRMKRLRSLHSCGISTYAAREGDKVVLVSGLSMPLIVREQEGGSVRLVSPAIIPDVMEGQAWPVNCELKEFVVS